MAKRRFFAKKLRYRENSLIRPHRYGDGSQGIDTKPIENELDRRVTTHAKDDANNGENQFIRGHKRFNDTIQLVDRDPFYDGYVPSSQATDTDGNVYTDNGKFPAMSMFTKNRLDTNDPDGQIEGRTSYSGVAVSTKTFSGLGEDAMTRNANAGLLFSSTKVSDTSTEKNRWDTSLSLFSKGVSIYADRDESGMLIKNATSAYFRQTVKEMNDCQVRLLAVILQSISSVKEYFGEFMLFGDSTRGIDYHGTLHDYFGGTNIFVGQNSGVPNASNSIVGAHGLRISENDYVSTFVDYGNSPTAPIKKLYESLVFIDNPVNASKDLSDIIQTMLIWEYGAYLLSCAHTSDEVDEIVNATRNLHSSGSNPFSKLRLHLSRGYTYEDTLSVRKYFSSAYLIPRNDIEVFLKYAGQYYSSGGEESFIYIKNFIDKTASTKVLRTCIDSAIKKLGMTSSSEAMTVILGLAIYTQTSDYVYNVYDSSPCTDSFVTDKKDIDGIYKQKWLITLAEIMYNNGFTENSDMDVTVTERSFAQRALLWSSVGLDESGTLRSCLKSSGTNVTWMASATLLRAFRNSFKSTTSEVDSGMCLKKSYKNLDKGVGSVTLMPSDNGELSLGEDNDTKKLTGIFSKYIKSDDIECPKLLTKITSWEERSGYETNDKNTVMQVPVGGIIQAYLPKSLANGSVLAGMNDTFMVNNDYTVEAVEQWSDVLHAGCLPVSASVFSINNDSYENSYKNIVLSRGTYRALTVFTDGNSEDYSKEWCKTPVLLQKVSDDIRNVTDNSVCMYFALTDKSIQKGKRVKGDLYNLLQLSDGSYALKYKNEGYSNIYFYVKSVKYQKQAGQTGIPVTVVVGLFLYSAIRVKKSSSAYSVYFRKDLGNYYKGSCEVLEYGLYNPDNKNFAVIINTDDMKKDYTKNNVIVHNGGYVTPKETVEITDDDYHIIAANADNSVVWISNVYVANLGTSATPWYGNEEEVVLTDTLIAISTTYNLGKKATVWYGVSKPNLTGNKIPGLAGLSDSDINFIEQNTTVIFDYAIGVLYPGEDTSKFLGSKNMAVPSPVFAMPEELPSSLITG